MFVPSVPVREFGLRFLLNLAAQSFAFWSNEKFKACLANAVEIPVGVPGRDRLAGVRDRSQYGDFFHLPPDAVARAAGAGTGAACQSLGARAETRFQFLQSFSPAALAWRSHSPAASLTDHGILGKGYAIT
jgi:hypothetical protein